MMPAPPVKVAPVSHAVPRVRSASVIRHAQRSAVHAQASAFVISTLMGHTSTALMRMVPGVEAAVQATAIVLPGNFVEAPAFPAVAAIA